MQEGVADDPGRDDEEKREDGEEGMSTMEVKQKAEGGDCKRKEDGAGEGCEPEEKARE
jgi:hypothetical protein